MLNPRRKLMQAGSAVVMGVAALLMPASARSATADVCTWTCVPDCSDAGCFTATLGACPTYGEGTCNYDIQNCASGLYAFCG